MTAPSNLQIGGLIKAPCPRGHAITAISVNLLLGAVSLNFFENIVFKFTTCTCFLEAGYFLNLLYSDHELNEPQTREAAINTIANRTFAEITSKYSKKEVIGFALLGKNAAPADYEPYYREFENV